MGYQKITVPADGDKITVNADLSLNVPNHPIIPYIEGDGIGVDISPVMIKWLMQPWRKPTAPSVASPGWKCSPGKKLPSYMGPMSGCPKKLWKPCGNSPWASRPLTTPVGGGIRSLNVSLRQELDLYTCMRPVRYFEGCPARWFTLS